MAAIALLLGAVSLPGATWGAAEVARAGVTATLRGLGLNRRQAAQLVELDVPAQERAVGIGRGVEP